MRMRPFWMVGLTLILAGTAVFLAPNWLQSQKPPIVEMPAPLVWATTAHALFEEKNTLTAEDWNHLHRTCRGPDLYNEECRELVLKFSYFPPGTLFSLSSHLSASRALVAMEEPVLSGNKAPGFEAYRLLYWGAGEGSLVVRIQNEDGAKTLVVKRPDSEGFLSTDRTYKLAPQEWDEVVRVIDKANYWHLANFNDRLGLDGSSCGLEGVKDGEFHVVVRWSPSVEDLPFQKACEYLKRLAFHTEAKPKISPEFVTDDAVCRKALAPRNGTPRWDHRPVPTRFAAEAERRGLSPERCAGMLAD